VDFGEGAIVRVGFQFTLPSYPEGMVNLYTAQVTGLPDPPIDHWQVWSDWLSWFGQWLAPLWFVQHDLVQYSGVGIEQWDGDDWVWGFQGPLTTSPAGAGSVLPAPVCAFLWAPVGISRVCGRKYFSGLRQEDLVDGLWASSALAALAAAGAVWITPFESSGQEGALWTPGVWSTKVAEFVPFDSRVLVSSVPAYVRDRRMRRVVP
jgi:hypothetical protein